MPTPPPPLRNNKRTTAQPKQQYQLTTHPATAHLAKEGFGLHFVCSAVAGVACATAVAPVDLIKSRYM